MKIPALPKLPTDNLYKFKALAGVWIIVLSYVINLGGMLYLEREGDAVRARAAVFKADADSLGEDIGSEGQSMAQLESENAEVVRAKASLDKQLTQIELQPHPSKAEADSARAQLDQITARDKRLGERVIAIKREVGELKSRDRAMRKDKALITLAADRVLTLTMLFVALAVFLASQSLLGFIWAREGFRDWGRLQNLEEERLRRDIERSAPADASGSSGRTV